MRKYEIGKNYGRVTVSLLACCLLLSACERDFLEEEPLDFLSAENVLVTRPGFENALVALHRGVRDEFKTDDGFGVFYFDNFRGTDVATTKPEITNFVNYQTYLTPQNHSEDYWDWAYSTVLVRANSIIEYGSKPEINNIWADEADKNRVLAEAMFFRAYAHNILAILYGNVPIADRLSTSPRTDFVQSTRNEVWDFARQDLEFASQWLPEEVPANQEGRIVKAAVDHLLTEVYISLGRYDDAIESASRVINSGKYKLMTTRFGSSASAAGDVFSDLFIEGNQNRSSGNMESIYIWQFEEFTEGGFDPGGGNHLLRHVTPFLDQLRDVDGKKAFLFGAFGRGVASVRPTNYALYNVWSGDWDNDIRNSEYNIKREFINNNPASREYRQLITKTSHIDTMTRIFPYIMKVKGDAWQGSTTSGKTSKDLIVYRLAETYLLRAEAHLRLNDLVNAAADINAVRARANATPVDPSDVDIDYILDERARELLFEEKRRMTLMRMGKLVERVRKYGMVQETMTSIEDKHGLYPIPQSAIDANFSKPMIQNAGYQ